MSRTVNIIKIGITYTAILLARFGIIDEERGIRTADLAWPRVVTGLARQSKQVIDLAMIGTALGPAAIAGMGFALPYWSIAMGIGFSFANGSMTFLTQRFGADDLGGVDTAMKQAIWIEIIVSLVLTVFYLGFAEQLIFLLGASPEAAAYGAIYLQVTALGLVFEMTTKVASRALISANDAWTPMVIRVAGAAGNIILNALLIFGLGLGVFGAALGTLIATMAVNITFTTGLFMGRLPGVGTFPVELSATPPYFDFDLIKQMIEVGTPLVAKRIVSRSSQFIMLPIVAQFGTLIVAAYAVARRVRSLMNTPGWGFGTAARSIVGQELGDNDEPEAMAYGWDILRFATVVYLMMAIISFFFAGQIAPLFTDEPETIEATVPFIRVMALSLLGLGIDSAASGILSAGGDTRWPLYARLSGLYLFMVPIAYLGVVTPLGVFALYLALTAETVVPAVITYYRFQTGKWKVISRRYRSSSTD